MTAELLKTHGLCKRYGDFTALADVSLTLRQGDIYGLIGRNGAGKTTFFKCVMGLAKSSGGTIEINGSSTKLNRARRQIGFMINPAFFPYLNPRQNLTYLSHVKGVRTKGVRTKGANSEKSEKGEVDRLLALVQLDGVKKPFKTFSLGMKQRLGLAGAMLGNPPVVVLDEPINGLDPQGIADIREIIRRENYERGTTFIVSSHILSELDLVANRFGFIEQGRLLQEIDHSDLHERTKKSLVVETSDAAGTLDLLCRQLGATGTIVDDRRLLLTSHFDQPNSIAKALVDAGYELYRLTPQETSLEEYFIRLVEQHNA